MTKHTYDRTTEESIPADVRFDVPARLAGQHVEYAYGGFGRYEHDEGAPYQRITDHSTGAKSYYVLVAPDLAAKWEMCRRVSQAIKRSVSHTEIVTIDDEPGIREQLKAAADDSVETNGRLECWGTDGDGVEWRVHVRLAE